MNDFRTKKTIIIASLGLLLAVNGLLEYHNAKLASKDQDPELILKNEARQAAMLKADVERANKIKARMPDVEKYFEQFETTLPPLGKGYSVISAELDATARETHVQVRDSKFRQKEVPGRNVDEVEIEATLDGDYTGIVKFLNHLQRSKNTYIVDSLGLDSNTITGVGNQSAAGTVKVALHMRSYFRKA